jgi:tetraacyldisaccharide 4'-kinase
MRTPEFWHETPGLVAGLLTPIGVALDAAGRLRRAIARPYRAPVPVVCVGNLVAGGSGKTPVVLALATFLRTRNVVAHIIMRGYGGRLIGPVRVDPTLHDAAAVGDEALLAATCAPSWVARDRAAGVRAVVAAGAEAILLDDGFQNPNVTKDISLVVVDAAYGFGNRRLIPAGPLRERVDAGLARADGIVLIDDGGEEPAAWLAPAGRTILGASLEPVNGDRFAGTRVVAFAGIGRPAKFFRSLHRLGAEIDSEHLFPDHHRFTDREIAELRRRADEAEATLVTTAKDFARLSPHRREGIAVLDVELRWCNEQILSRMLAPLLARISDDGPAARR